MDLAAALRGKESEDEEEHGDDDEAEGAAADLAALSTGVVLPQGGARQLEQWCRALERSTSDAFAKLTRGQRNTVDLAQQPRYMLLQQVHYATVRELLTAPPRLRDEGRMWELRTQALAGMPGASPQLPKDVMSLLEKHSAPGLTKTYKRHVFGQKKENLRKIKKTLAAAVPPHNERLPATPPQLPRGLAQDLNEILLKPPGWRGADPADEAASLESWVWAADATLSLSCITGSLLTMLQLPRAVYCRGVNVRRRRRRTRPPVNPPRLFSRSPHNGCTPTPCRAPSPTIARTSNPSLTRSPVVRSSPRCRCRRGSSSCRSAPPSTPPTRPSSPTAAASSGRLRPRARTFRPRRRPS